uniref:Uncharacterized protein n=1 Tax=Coprothermobacter proteolyticus (strain ATCC 35245 / DSM 5265 / OCM 4 / BT) TaxID=309798 RepID=B5Y6P0_COPPD
MGTMQLAYSDFALTRCKVVLLFAHGWRTIKRCL